MCVARRISCRCVTPPCPAPLTSARLPARLPRTGTSPLRSSRRWLFLLAACSAVYSRISSVTNRGECLSGRWAGRGEGGWVRQAYPERTLVRARVDTHVGVTATRVWYAWDVRSLIYLVRGGLWFLLTWVLAYRRLLRRLLARRNLILEVLTVIFMAVKACMLLAQRHGLVSQRGGRGAGGERGREREFVHSPALPPLPSTITRSPSSDCSSSFPIREHRTTLSNPPAPFPSSRPQPYV